MYKQTLFLFFYVILFLGNAEAQTNNDISSHLLTPEQMREDIEFFYKKLVETHPNPYYAISKEELEAKIQDISNNLNTPLSKTEFWMRIAQLNCYFDAHTHIGMNRSFKEYFENQKNILPCFALTLEGDHLFFNKNTTFWPDSLSGLQIESINNISANRIVRDMKSYHSHEYSSSQNFPQQKRWIEDVLPLIFYYLYGKSDTFSIEYKNIEGAMGVYELSEVFPFNVNYPEQINDKIKPESKQVNTTQKQKAYDLKFYPKDSVALLEFNTFSPHDLNGIDTNSKRIPFEINPKPFFAVVKILMDSIIDMGVKDLFIDITDNGGGSSQFGSEFLNYLQATPSQKINIAYSDVKVSDVSRFMHSYHFSFWDRLKVPFYKPYRQFFMGKKGKIVHLDFYWQKSKKDKEYAGNVYLLQSWYTFSAAVDLASVFKIAKIGQIIGEETGGKTNEYINSYPFILPNSKNKFLCSIQYTVLGNKEDGRGVLPDIEYKIEDPSKSFTLEQLKEMLQLVEKKKAEDK